MWVDRMDFVGDDRHPFPFLLSFLSSLLSSSFFLLHIPSLSPLFLFLISTLFFNSLSPLRLSSPLPKKSPKRCLRRCAEGL